MSKNDFVEVATIHDAEGIGLVAPITIKEKANGYLVISFALMREFERGGLGVERTCYLNARHIPALRLMLDEVEQQLKLEKEKLFNRRRNQ